MKKCYLLLFAIIICKSSFAQSHYVPDSSFHTTSYAPVYVGGINAIATDTNNNIIAGVNQCYGSTYYISKFDGNGIVDTLFGIKGEALYYIGTGSASCDLVKQNDGHIVSAGVSTYCVGGVCGMENVVVLRNKPDGTPDSSFTVVTSDKIFGGGVWAASAHKIKQVSNGKFIIGGTVSFGDATKDGIYLARLNKDGTPDNTFGDGGVVRRPGFYISLSDMVIDKDENIYTVGIGWIHEADSLNNDDGYVWKVKENGKTDSSFGVNGQAVIDYTHWDMMYALQLRSDGKIIVGGAERDDSGYGNDTSVVVALNADGTLSSLFPGGRISLQVPNYSVSDIYAMTLTADNKIIFAGGAQSGLYTSSWKKMAFIGRLDSDGSPDTSFGINKNYIDTCIYGPAFGCIHLLSKGKILLGGNNFFVQMRPLDSTPDTSTSVATIYNEDIVVYPNPAKNSIELTVPENGGDETYIVADIRGKKLLQDKIYTMHQTVDISKLEPGIYFIIISNKEGRKQIKKIVKE